MKRPRVLVVAGAYYPEISGGGLQARALIRALRDRADFVVLTTSRAATETVCALGRFLIDQLGGSVAADAANA